MEKMIRGNEVMFTSSKGNVSVAYAREDIGEKYKVYRKVRYDENIVWEYIIGFNALSEALMYAGQIIDVEFVR